jgi:hypothetical protein
MYDIGQARTYEGLPSEVMSSAPPGIFWLKSFWASLDSLDISASPPLTTVVTADCQFHINGATPRGLDHVLESLQQRANFLSEFGHTKYPVRVIDVDLDEGRRILSVQSSSV